MNGRAHTPMLRGLLAAVFAAIFLVGCASGPDLEQQSTAGLDASRQYAASTDIYDEQIADSGIDDPNDPLEVINRFIFAINETLDVFIFKPAAATYRFLVPPVVRNSFRNFIRNVETPVVLINDLLQGDMNRAETTAARFMINTIVGVAGFADIARDSGYAYHDEDFGQTLGTWGAGPGPYLVLPLFGPSGLRDGFGVLVDKFFDPMTYLGFYYGTPAENASLGKTAVKGVDFRSRNIETLEELQRDSVDFYARIRSVYLQRRVDEINNGKISDDLPTPGLSQARPIEQVSGTD